jgi:hypothetical protein
MSGIRIDDPVRVVGTLRGKAARSGRTPGRWREFRQRNFIRKVLECARCAALSIISLNTYSFANLLVARSRQNVKAAFRAALQIGLHSKQNFNSPSFS